MCVNSEPRQASPHTHRWAAVQLRVLWAALYWKRPAAPPHSQQAPGGPATLLQHLQQILQRYLRWWTHCLNVRNTLCINVRYHLDIITVAVSNCNVFECLRVSLVWLYLSLCLLMASYSAIEQLRVHVRRHKGMRKFECTECGYKFTRQVWWQQRG